MFFLLPNYPIINNQPNKELTMPQFKNYFTEYKIEKEKPFNFVEACEQYYEEKLQAATKDVLKNIMENDKNFPKHADAEELSRMIMDVSNKSGVDPVIITCIAQHETHFDQTVDHNNGKGIMQVVLITVKDMYQRPSIYSKEMAKYMKEYGSLEKIFQAKDQNPDMDLGDLGEMLYQHKTPQQLLENVKKDTYTALKAGAYAFIGKLYTAKSISKGDKNFEKKALELYNSVDDYKMNYSESIYSQIVKHRNLLKSIDIII